MLIYKITNKTNGKIYVGLTVKKSALHRFTKHVSEAKNTNENRYFLNAIRKYGRDNFIVEEIDKANSIEELKQKEIFYINFYNSTNRNIGYNRSLGGDGTSGVKKSEETRNKIRQKALGRKWSEERKVEHSKMLKLSNRDYNKQITNFKTYNETKKKNVEKYDLENNLIKSYESIALCLEENKLDRAYFLYKVKNNKDYKGFIYKIKE